MDSGHNERKTSAWSEPSGLLGGAVRSAVRRLPGAGRAVLTARFGDVRRTAPLTNWGSRRGTPVDRWYIERYLDSHADVVTGRVLEVKSDQYASRFGASDVEVVDIDPSNPNATVMGDLCDPSTLEQGRYQAAIVTQTLQFVADPAAAVRSLVASLQPDGALLLTVPSLSRVCGPSDRWRWTPAGLEHLLASTVPPGAAYELCGLGNGLAGRAFLFGLAAEEMPAAALRAQDVSYPLVVGACVRLAG